MNTNVCDADNTLTRECVSTTSDTLVHDIIFEIFDIKISALKRALEQ